MTVWVLQVSGWWRRQFLVKERKSPRATLGPRLLESQCVTSCCTETPHTGFQSNQLTSNQCVTSGFSSWLSKPADDQLKEHLASCSFKAGCLKSVSVQSMTTQTLTRKLTNDQPTATLQTREAISQESIFQSFQCCSEEAVSFRLLSISDQLTNIVSISDPAWPIWWSQSKAPQPVHRQHHLSFLRLLWLNKKSRECLQVSSAPVSSYRSPKSINKVWPMLSSSQQRSEHIAQAAKWVPRWSMDNNRARTLAKGQHCWWRQLDLWPWAMDLIIFALWDHWQLTS